MDIFFNLKVENMMESQMNNNIINSSRGGHGRDGGNMIEDGDSVSNASSSMVSNRDGPPKVYEEIIQGLEGDVRKHIRIEQ